MQMPSSLCVSTIVIMQQGHLWDAILFHVLEKVLKCENTSEELTMF